MSRSQYGNTIFPAWEQFFRLMVFLNHNVTLGQYYAFFLFADKQQMNCRIQVDD